LVVQAKKVYLMPEELQRKDSSGVDDNHAIENGEDDARTGMAGGSSEGSQGYEENDGQDNKRASVSRAGCPCQGSLHVLQTKMTSLSMAKTNFYF
jgi:hypothetical protein